MAFSSSSLSCPVSFLPLQKHLVPSHNYHHPRHRHRHHHHHRRKPLNSVQNNPLSTNSIHFSRTNPRFSMIKCLSQRQSTQQTPPPAKQEQQQQQDEYYEFERLFSSLNQATLKREPGSVSSAIFLVAGTTVGAGILAIPAVTKEAGFLASAVTCIICWVFMENELLHVPKGQAQNAHAQMFSDPNMAMDMMKKNLSMIISQMLTFAWVNFFFSGFVAAKMPFPLTQRFRSMLQNGIDLSTVDVRYFSSRSWYFLNLFGLRGLFSLILGEENAMDDTQRMIQMDGFGMDPTTIVYDPYERLNELADEVDKNAGLSRLTLFSPCKVNIFLRITRKREDGFHDLASLFHVISLGDKIKFSLSPSKTQDRLSTNVPGVPLDERNLIIKALNLYRKKTSSDKYFWIHLDKKVPTGAGLGGGSSNAATALWAANQFNDCLVSEKELQEWSSEIGSDVPFFFSHGVGYCTGRGEVVKDIPPPIPLDTPIVLIKPREACSTAEVYKRLCLDQTSKVDPLHLLEKISTNGIYQDVCINDLESPAFEVLPSLRRLKQRVIAASCGQYDAVFMSGSGSTIVGIGSPDPPQFIYDDEEYQDVFISEANFIIREANQWYSEPVSSSSTCPGAEFSQPGK